MMNHEKDSRLKNRYANLMDSLISSINDIDIQKMKAYHEFFKDKQEDLRDWLTKELMDHPVFGEVIRSMPKDALEKQWQLSQQIQYHAIFEGKWEEYILHQIQQGIQYAQMNVSFHLWYDVLSLVRNRMIPILMETSPNYASILPILEGMNRFYDLGMGVMAEAYLGEKQNVIENQKMEEKRINKKLKRTLHEMGLKNQELEQFAYIASHDLKEPLRTASSFSKLFEKKYKDALDEKGKMYLSHISGSHERMITLINGLLEYSHIGKEGEREILDCNRLISEVLEDLDQMIKENNAKVTCEKLPVLEGFPTQLKLLFQNLITNAIKFRKKEVNPIIDITAQDNQNHWEVCVRDNGIGIEEAYYQKIFNIFQRLHTKKEYNGTGIGLAHCKKIVELHGGKIWVSSQPGTGSKFYFSIPKQHNHDTTTQMHSPGR